MSAVEECYRGEKVRVFRLDRGAIVDDLRVRARKLIDDRSDVLEVRLFGSLARGDATPGSDADIIVVLGASNEPFLERVASFCAALTGTGIGCDVLPYTVAELADLRQAGNSFLERAWAESVPLAVR